MDCLLIPCFMASWLPFVITQYIMPLAVSECESVGLQCMHELNLSLISYHCLVLYILGQWINLLKSQESKMLPSW